MLKPFLVSMLLCTALSVQAQQWRDGLSELQQFRTYPYVDKAFRLHQQQQYAAAAAELTKAVAIVPEHGPLLAILFDYQLAVPDVAAALGTYRQLPAALRQNRLLQLAQTQLDLQQPLMLDDYRELAPGLSDEQQQQLLRLVSEHLIAGQQLQQAYDWLLAQSQLSDALLLQRAELASQLGKPEQVIRDTEASQLASRQTQDWLRYSAALVSTQQAGRAATLANAQPQAQWSVRFYRQWLQSQIAAADWAGAERSFSWLQQYDSLSDAEQQQRYQTALSAGNSTLAISLIAGLDQACLAKVTMYLQNQANSQARSQFISCPLQQSALWLTYADRWLTANALEAVVMTSPALAQRKAQMVAQKRIAGKDFRRLLQDKFSRPLRRQDYNLLLASINELADPALQTRYLRTMYQSMPDDYLLDKLSYQYLQQHQPEQALQLLQQALPFSSQAMQQQLLPQRFLNLLAAREVAEPALLRQLDSWPIFITERAELWRLAGDCASAERLILQQSTLTSGWQTLALCSNNVNPARAIHYWQQANLLQATPAYLKQIAYQYQLLHQPQAALQQLQALPAEELLAADVLTMAELALQGNNPALAQQYLKQAKPEQAVDQARYFAIQAAWYGRQNQPDAAMQSWLQAATLAPERADYQLNYAYALAATEPQQAIALMLQVAASGHQFSATEAAQLAYLNQRLQQSDATQKWTEQTLLLYPLQQPLSTAELKTQFSLHRLQQQLASHWQLSSSLTFSSGAVTGERLAPAEAELAKHGMALKAEYFFDALQRDLSFYALVASNGDTSPWHTWGDQFGVSYKPLTDFNLWLSAGLQQYPLGDGDWQSLLRLTADVLNADPWQAEWRPTEQDWWERKLYLDLVWWPDSGNRQAQLRFDQGAVWKPDTRLVQTLKWYGLAQIDYRRQDGSEQPKVSAQQLTAGMGLQWRYWPGEAPVLLARQRFEVNLEWQYQLAGDLNRRQHALLLQLYFVW